MTVAELSRLLGKPAQVRVLDNRAAIPVLIRDADNTPTGLHLAVEVASGAHLVAGPLWITLDDLTDESRKALGLPAPVGR